ncbi:MAG: S8 family serine peptidase, partial [Desulfocucumaceae bacterium]
MKYRKSLFAIIAALIITAAVVAGDKLSPGLSEAQLLNDRSQQIVGADMVNAPGFITPAGLTGKGQVVAVADSGLDRGSMEDIHPDLAGEPGQKPKIIMLKSWSGRQLADDPVGHGTHMVGTIAGNGSASGGKFRGVAPEANIYFQGILDAGGKISPPSDLEKLFQPAYLAGARIHVNAWGSGDNGYSGSAMKADAFIRRHPDFLAIFGAGNSGPGTGSLTSEANSKNSLTVGSSVSPRPALDFSPGGTLDTAGFSSRGPAGDGRIKPDLLAPGTSIISTRSSLVKGNLPGYPQYSRMQGSSMASAVAAGSAALLREFMQKEMSLPDPGASSIKAALINGARTPDEGPSAEGFGVLDLGGTVLALKEKSMVLVEENKGISEGVVQRYRFRAETSQSPVKVTLAWTDPAGDPAAQKALVNNLDLSVISPDGKTYSGNSFLGRSPDDLNNVEQVYIKDPISGEYVIEVRAASVKAIGAKNSSAPAQDYSLVYGQPLATGIIMQVVPGGDIQLYGGKMVSPTGKNLHYLLDGRQQVNSKLEPGFRIYYGGRSVYISGRLWKPESVQYREGLGGRIWFESDQEKRDGGYYQSPESGKGLTVNGSYMDDITGLPLGIEMVAGIDGPTQTLWSPSTSYRIKKGNVGRIVPGENGGISSIGLFNEKRDYRVSPSASYIYNDNFEKTDPLEMVFGSGNLNGMRRIMTGQQVSLVMSRASNIVSS